MIKDAKKNSQQALLNYHLYEALPEKDYIMKLLPCLEIEIDGHGPLKYFMEVRSKMNPKRIAKPSIDAIKRVVELAKKFHEIMMYDERTWWMTDNDKKKLMVVIESLVFQIHGDPKNIELEL